MYSEDFPCMYVIFLVNEKDLDLLSHGIGHLWIQEK